MPSTTMDGQRIYHLKCCRIVAGRDCGYEYGANGADAHNRKCPECQGGAKGEPLPEATRSLFA